MKHLTIAEFLKSKRCKIGVEKTNDSRRVLQISKGHEKQVTGFVPNWRKLSKQWKSELKPLYWHKEWGEKPKDGDLDTIL
jgi:hypothetical protein